MGDSAQSQRDLVARQRSFCLGLFEIRIPGQIGDRNRDHDKGADERGEPFAKCELHDCAAFFFSLELDFLSRTVAPPPFLGMGWTTHLANSLAERVTLIQ